MRVTIDFDESLIQPLLQKHLEIGTSVQEEIATAVEFYNDCIKACDDKEVSIISCKLSRNYANNRKVLMGKAEEF